MIGKDKEKKIEKELAPVGGDGLKKGDVFYSRPVALNSELHRQIKIAKISDYKIAKQLNSSILTGYEFFEAAKYYPIAFSRTPDEEIMPVAILGVTDNAFTDEEGKWKEGFYIPAFINANLSQLYISKTKEAYEIDDKLNRKSGENDQKLS